MVGTFYYVLLYLAAIFALISIRRVARPFHVLCILLIYTYYAEIVAFGAAYVYHNNSLVYHLFIPVHYTLLCLVYYGLVKASPGLRKALLVSVPVMYLFFFLNIFFFQPAGRFPSNISLLECFFVVLFSLLLFNNMLENPLKKSLFLQAGFWFITLNLVYQALIFFELAFYNWMRYSDIVSSLEIFTTVANYIIYTGFCGVLLLSWKKKKSLYVQQA